MPNDSAKGKLPFFLKSIFGSPNLIVEKAQGGRTFYWIRGDDFADLHGEWTIEELRQIVDMMVEAAPKA